MNNGTGTTTNDGANNGDTTGAGDAGNVVEDVVDGVGEAGKDLIDGVENGVDDMTGNNAGGATKNE